MYQNQNPPTKNPRGCALYGCLIAVALPFLLIGLVVVLVAMRDRSARTKVNDYKQRYVSEGLPIDNQTLDAYYDQLASEEDTELWMELIQESNSDALTAASQGIPGLSTTEATIPKSVASDPALQAPPDTTTEADTTDLPSDSMESSYGGEDFFQDSQENSPVWDQSQVRDFLDETSSLRARIRRAAAKQLTDGARPVRYPIQFEGINTLLEHAQQLRQLGRIVNLEGQMAVYDRDSSKAYHSIRSLMGTSRTLRGEPFLVSQLVRIALDSMAIQLLKLALEQDVLAEKELVALLPLIMQEVQISPSWTYSLHGERAAMLPIFEGDMAGVDTPNIPFRSNDALTFLEINRDAANIETGDMERFREELAALEERLQQVTSGGFLQQLDSILTVMLAPALSAAGDAFVRNATEHRLAALAMGLRIYEDRHGEFPPNLEDLKSLQIDEVSLDPAWLKPIGKKPFGYEVTQEGVAIWGFSLRTGTETPDQRPTVDPTVPYASENELWLWELPIQQTATP